MFGFVMANLPELPKEDQARYQAVYCGICRQIRTSASNVARLGLRYDMAFLALLLMSLYEPEETAGNRACRLHPIRPRPWVDNRFIRYSADMNVALAYYKALDDMQDEGSISARAVKAALETAMPAITERYPRQCAAMEDSIRELNRLEKENCNNPDAPAGCFGHLMAQLLVYEQDIWADTLYQMGMALGRFIYLADAAVDYRRDKRKKQYNPFLAMDTGEDPARWEQYLVMAMGKCTENYERLPLVQDKAILDNILYSGIWIEYRRRSRKRPQEENNDR